MRAGPQEPPRQFAGIRYLAPSQTLSHLPDSKGPLNSWIRQASLDSRFSSKLKSLRGLQRLQNQLKQLQGERESLKEQVIAQLQIRPRSLFNEIGSSLRTISREVSQSMRASLQSNLKRVQGQIQKRVATSNKQIQRLSSCHQVQIEQFKGEIEQLLQELSRERECQDELRVKVNELSLLLTKSKLQSQNLSSQLQRAAKLLQSSQAQSEVKLRKLRQELNNCSAYVKTHNFDQLEMRYSDLIVQKMHLLRNNDDCHLQLHNSQLQLKDLNEKAQHADFLSLQNSQLCQQLARHQQTLTELNRQLQKQSEKEKNTQVSFRDLQQLSNQLKKNYSKSKESLEVASIKNRELQTQIASLKDRLQKKAIQVQVSLQQNRIDFQLKQDASIKELRRDFHNKQIEWSSSMEKKSKQLQQSQHLNEQLRLQIEHLKNNFSKKQQQLIGLLSARSSLQKQRNQQKLLLKQKQLELEKLKDSLNSQLKQTKDQAAARQVQLLQVDRLTKQNSLLNKNLKAQQASMQTLTAKHEQKKRQCKANIANHMQALRSRLSQSHLNAGFQLIYGKMRGLVYERWDIQKQQFYRILENNGVESEEMCRLFGDLLLKVASFLTKLSDRILQLQTELGRQTSKNRTTQSKVRELDGQVVQLKSQEEFLQNKIRQTQSQVQRLTASNGKEMQLCIERYQGALKSIRGLQKNESELQDRLVQKQMMLKQLFNKITYLEKEKDSLKIQSQNLSRNLETKGSQNKLFFSLIHQLQDELQQQSDLKHYLQRQNQKIGILQKQLQTALKQKRFLQGRLQQASVRLQEQQVRTRELQSLAEQQRQRCEEHEQRLQEMQTQVRMVREREGSSQEEYLQRLKNQYSQKLRRLMKI